MVHMYDPGMEHWIKCQDQIDAVLSHVDISDMTPCHSCWNYPYESLSKESPASQRVNAGMFNVTRDLFGEEMFTEGYAIDIGSGGGWAAWQMAKYKKTISLDICDHPHYGIGSQLTDIGFGIRKAVADVCYMPFRDSSIDIAFSCSSFHHAHDRAKCLAEVYRTLCSGGKFVAIGECVVMPDQWEIASRPEWVRMEGLPNSRESMEGLLSDSPFESIEYLPIRYTPNMHHLGYYSLVGEPIANGIIYGVKG
jgi:SAM-dependent methyltransferase